MVGTRIGPKELALGRGRTFKTSRNHSLRCAAPTVGAGRTKSKDAADGRHDGWPCGLKLSRL